MTDKSARGRFVWYELMTSDPDAAAAFYPGVTGWGTAPWEGGQMHYTLWMNGDAPLGGVMRLPAEVAAAGVPPHWLAYIATPDVDATARQATELGGTLMVPPTDVPSIGQFAVIGDPQGAVFAVFKPAAEAPGHDGPPTRGDFSWHELMTTDHAAAFDFYSKLFGWEKTSAMDIGPMGTYQMYGRNGMTLGGMYNKPTDMPVPPNWLLYVMVDDVNRAADRVRELGGQVVNGPMEVPGGDWIAQCIDPQGAAFAVHAPKQAS